MRRHLKTDFVICCNPKPWLTQVVYYVHLRWSTKVPGFDLQPYVVSMFLSSTMKKSLLRVMQAEGGSSFALFTGCFHYIKVPSRSFPLFPLRRLTPCQGGKSDEVRRQFEKISSRTSTFAKKHRREINADEAGPRVTRDPRADDGWFLGISFDPTTNGRRKARRTAFGRRKTMEHGP